MGRETLRAVEVWPQADLRRQQRDVLQGMLHGVGERGYARCSVQIVLERSGASRDRFYRHFKNKHACFQFAYESEMAAAYELVRDVASASPGWREGFRAGLAELFACVSADPTLARALLIEAAGAGPELNAAREKYMRRFAQLLDTARLEPGARRAAVPQTAELLVGGIEATLRRAVLIGPAAGDCPIAGLGHLVALNYFGEEAARQELAAAQREARRRDPARSERRRAAKGPG